MEPRRPAPAARPRRLVGGAALLCALAFGVAAARVQAAEAPSAPFVVEGEALVRGARASEGTVKLESMRDHGDGWSGWAQLRWRPFGEGQTLGLVLVAPADGTYRVDAAWTRGPDAGDVRVSVRGRMLEPTLEGWSPRVDLIENAHVDRILVEDGRAVGVVARGVEYRAEKLVASNADVHQTLIGLVGEEHLSPLWAKRAKDFRFGPSHVLATPMFCLYEAPAYRSARWDPEIDKCFYTVVGYDGPDDMARYIRDAYSGLLPAPAAGTWVNSLWDRSQAPPGRHAATGWYFFPVASELSTEEWEEVRTTFNDRFLARWREFAPNMTADNVIAHKLYTPDQMERKNMMREGDFSHGEFVPDQQGVNRPFPEASNYRTEIEGLYLCGSSAYPGGGVHAACGYNAYKKIAEDFGLPSPIGSGRSY